MKKAIYFLFVVIKLGVLPAQTFSFNYSVKLKPLLVQGFSGLHSYAYAQSQGKWLIIGGRKDGLHARQPFNSFPASYNNTNIYVIDIYNQQMWTSTINNLSNALKEQLQSTNMNFYQDEDSLYLVGGYGYSNTIGDHVTFSNLTSVSVSGLINAIINNQSINSHFKQVTDSAFAVCGGHLGKIGSTFYLIGGHRFDGRYNPMGNPTYTQTYVDGIRKFKLLNFGSQLSFSAYSVSTDQVHLHRRDYNLIPQIFPDGQEGYTISSGVFQPSVNLPFLYPIDIKTSGYSAITSFNQYLSNYHSSNIALYDSVNNSMHSLFFGGMSQYSYSNTILIQDQNVPFIKTISRVSRDAFGNLQETVFNTEMPDYLGASSELIPNHQLPHYSNEVIKLSQLNGDSILLGHIVGGILSSQANPFSNNNTSVTSANSIIYEVWLTRSFSSGFATIDGRNAFEVVVFPNPGKKQVSVKCHLPYTGNLSVSITDVTGKIVQEIDFGKINKGSTVIDLSESLKLYEGLYQLNFLFDGKFSRVEKLIIKG